MPGMMDTILNLGLERRGGRRASRARPATARFALDSYRRLIQMFGEVVDGIDGHRFEDALAELKRERGAAHDTDLTADDLDAADRHLPADLRARRRATSSRRTRASSCARAVRAVFDSWDTPRAQVYRRANEIPDDIGTAVNVVQMVFGNKGDRSGTGVAFTRDPSTGESGAVRRVPRERAGRGRRRRASARRSRSRRWATRCRAPTSSCSTTLRRLEQHYRDMQDVEFTVEDGRLYLLQTRAAEAHRAPPRSRSPSRWSTRA